jgi:hypothetical protein
MGNAVVKLNPCLAGRESDETVQPPQSQCETRTTIVTPSENIEEIGQSISFRRDATSKGSDGGVAMPFQTIHYVSLGANQLTPSSIMNDSFSSSSSLDRSSSFSSFALHPSSSSFSSSSDPSYSGILVRSDSRTIFQEIQLAKDRRNQEKLKNPSVLHRFKSVVSSRIKKYTRGLACASDIGTVEGIFDEGRSDPSAVHWAQGKAGEDRVHVVYSEEHQLLFVGIYDGFNGPDAPDFLLANLYQDMLLELEGIQWEQQKHHLVI